MHYALHCSACNEAHDIAQPQNVCVKCAKPLFAAYRLGAIRDSFRPAMVRVRPIRSMWKYAEVLPVSNPASAVSLGEGLTPLLPADRRGAFQSFTKLWIKDESFNPTASFKARGMAAAITRAVELGIRTVALPSAGNAAGAAAAYAARVGLKCILMMPSDTPLANIVESAAQGAEVYLVRGLISDAGKLVRDGCKRFGWFDLSTLREPFRVEGKKIMGYELALDLQAATGSSAPKLPDVIIYPAGGGTGLVGMWKAFDEMQQLGWIGSERPRMVAVQAAGCAPIVRAYQAGQEFAEPVANAHTIAAGLRVPGAIADFLMLRAIRSSNGTALSVTDEELMTAQHELAREQGIFACPEGGATWAAARKLFNAGWLNADDEIVLFNTGSGLKYTHLEKVPDLPVLDPADADWARQLHQPEV
jgi:threonine synthase